ncbi:ceramide synthase 2 [Aplysia californica]|uniref:Ceramide synthase 2 n=1 Tax=Aplysia californica TaxID=6500 RepID=A0ABM0JI09_APLCA|nr:ceramide synthase 2 [Aplysia californica]
MANLWGRFYDSIWNEKFWLGDDATWDDFVSDDPSVYYPKISHMNWSIAVGVLLLLVRHLYETYLINPFGYWLGLKERKHIHLVESPVLEGAYRKFGWRVKKHEVQSLVKQTDMSERQIERWLFKRRIREMPSSMYKFRECSWQVLFYTASFVWGMYALWDKPWLWVTVNCWVGWPKQHIDNDIFILYLLELSFYWSLLFAVLFRQDYKKKDKNEMVLHHVVTILLLYFSWAVNMVRVGSLVVVVHDVADPWLNIAKMAKYAKYQTTCEIFFGIFILIWIISRIFVYPLWVLNASAVEIHDYVTTFPAYWFFNGLLFVLQMLHILWTYLILSIAFQKFTLGTIEKDIRSESDGEISDSPVEEAAPVIGEKSASGVNGIRQGTAAAHKRL